MTIDKGSISDSETRPASAAGDSGRESGEGSGGSPISFRLEPASGVPTYRQLVQQVEQALRLGYLSEGDRLPTVKEAVESLAINPNTVLKAYRELEHRGLAAGRPGQGTFISGALRRVGLAEQAELRESLLGWLRGAGQAGLDDDGIEALFAACLRDFRDRRDEGASAVAADGGAGVAARGAARPVPPAPRR
ncbi:MAG: GntR family transcriptional regulator [Streptosporangiaceae bacterium]